MRGACFCRIVGDRAREEKTGVPPILVVSRGYGYDYLENLEALTVSDRRVVEVLPVERRHGNTPAALLSYEACAASSGCRALLDVKQVPQPQSYPDPLL